MLLDSPSAPSSSLSTITSSSRETLVGDSPTMQRLRAEIHRYAPRNGTVLIQGETGTGKELVARALHDQSPRARNPFVAVNVATLRSDLAPSELFGHVRGAFTGAFAAHRGVFEQAHGGTLFLDEVGELDPAAQADLLRVLETGEVRPVGSERTRTVDVRLIAATHRNLVERIASGTFRADLFYRLNVLPITVPALRERPEDIPTLIDHLLDRVRPEAGARSLTTQALGVLARRAWPGNVRELLNVLRRATARSDATLLGVGDFSDAPEPAPTPPAKPPRVVTKMSTADLTQARVLEAFDASGGRIAAAARRLGLPRTTYRDHLRAALDPEPITPLE